VQRGDIALGDVFR